jgi:hypothetical protein
MIITLSGEEFKIKMGEYIRTTKGEGRITLIENLYEFIYIIDMNGNKIKVKPSEVIGVDKLPESDLADKELIKDGKVKPILTLIPQLALEDIAAVFMYGAAKYGEYNFSKGGPNTDYINASLRHINKYMLNEDMDDESGLSHLAHAIANLMMILDNTKNNTNIDKRNKLYK